MSDRLELIGENSSSPQWHYLGRIRTGKNAPASPVLGYLARLCPLKGLDILVDAFLQLKSTDKYPDLRLEIAGGMTAEDEPFVDEQRRKLTQAGLTESFSIRPNADRDEKLDFLRKLSIISVPSRYPEAFGLYVIEALAAGVPVVLPESGAFPELVEQTGGGRIYQTKEPSYLPEALEPHLEKPEQAKSMGLAGHESVSRLLKRAIGKAFGRQRPFHRETHLTTKSMASEFTITRRVEFSETDLAGIMHFTNFYRWMEICEHEFLRSLGLSVDMEDENGRFGWPRVKTPCRFKRPLRFEEVVEVKLIVAEIRDRSIRYAFQFWKEENGDRSKRRLAKRLPLASGLSKQPVPWLPS